MASPFSFQGQIGRLPYALWSIGIFLSQDLAMLGVYWAYASDLPAPFGEPPSWKFYVMPQWGMVPTLVTVGRASDGILILTLGYLLIAAWAFAALSFRRAANANITGWTAAAAI